MVEVNLLKVIQWRYEPRHHLRLNMWHCDHMLKNTQQL
jgi:hypothetical protein